MMTELGERIIADALIECIAMSALKEIKTLIQRAAPVEVQDDERVSGHTIFRISSPGPKRVAVVPTTVKPHAV
jgi:hypothetical protein